MFPVVFTETIFPSTMTQPKIGGWVLAIVPERRSPRLLALISLMAIATMFGLGSSSADEGGASFWSPGTFANLAAVPGEPGWSFSATYFHATLMGGSNQATADTLPRFPRTTLTTSTRR